jgi:hypothetical protein
MPEDEMQMIAMLLKNTDTKLFQMHVSKTNFELVAKRVEFTEIDYRAVKKSN